MTYSAFGYSLPQLNVTGYAAPVAAYGGSISVDINVENLGASSLPSPLSLSPGTLGPTDSPATSVQVYASTSPTSKTYLLLGSVDIPAIRQNSDYETVTTLPIPQRPATFPKTGNFYLTLAVNNDRSILQTSIAGNVYHIPKPVELVSDDLPNLQVVGFDIPQTLQPGDVVAPTIRIENFGVGDPGAQGGVTVALVASLDKRFGVGDAVVSSFRIDSLPGISGVPTQTTISAVQNLFTTPNELTVTLPAFQLPTTPGFYYLGIKIDPTHQINQTYGPTSKLSDPIPVGPADAFLVPTSTQVAAVNPVFPNLPVTFVNTTGAGQLPIITPFGTVVPTASVAAASVDHVAAKAVRINKHRHQK